MNIRAIVMAALVAASVVSSPAYAEGKIEIKGLSVQQMMDKLEGAFPLE